jgi:hypothetical protein
MIFKQELAFRSLEKKSGKNGDYSIVKLLDDVHNEIIDCVAEKVEEGLQKNQDVYVAFEYNHKYKSVRALQVSSAAI